MTILNIKKRDGEIVPFDRTRIENAISMACDAIGHRDKNFIPSLTDAIIEDISAHRLPAVEDIQDAVEKNLMKAEFFEIAKEYILYREHRKTVREADHLEYVKKFENRTLTVTKRDGSTELFDLGKIRRVYDRVSQGFEKTCPFSDMVEVLKDSVVDEMTTKDISRLLIKTTIDLISIENISWQNIAGRIMILDLYKQASRNRNIPTGAVYSGENFKALFDTYIMEGLYYKDFYKYYSDEEILKAGNHISKTQDFEYPYTTTLAISKRYLMNYNKVVRELPQEMYMAVALFLAIPEKDEDRFDIAMKIYDMCSGQKISLPTPTLMNARSNFHQLSSCFKMSIEDDLRAIYHNVENIAQISKF